MWKAQSKVMNEFTKISYNTRICIGGLAMCTNEYIHMHICLIFQKYFYGPPTPLSLGKICPTCYQPVIMLSLYSHSIDDKLSYYPRLP